MSLPIILSQAAVRDLGAAVDWYEEASGSGKRFVSWVQEIFEGIGQMPELHVVVYRDIRRARVPKSPYNVYYRVLNDHVEILAVVHGRRDPSVWQSRG